MQHQSSTMNLPHKPVHEKKWLERYLKTNYYKKKYDRFMWWRSFTLRNPPLSNRHPFRDRILNGDFDLGPYVYELELVEHKLNETHARIGHDEVQLREAVQMDKARRKRLQEDRDKDEFNKLAELRRCFLAEFKMTKVQYDREVVKYRGPDLINFYYRMEDRFGKRAVALKKVPTF
jgi:hypothetical protein